MFSQNLGEEEGSEAGIGMLYLPFVISDMVFNLFEMPNHTEGAHAIFMIFQKGSWTNKRLRTLPRRVHAPAEYTWCCSHL